MIDPQTWLTLRNGKWHIMARKGAEGVAEGAWVSLGGYACQLTAIRAWLACQGQGRR